MSKVFYRLYYKFNLYSQVIGEFMYDIDYHCVSKIILTSKLNLMFKKTDLLLHSVSIPLARVLCSLVLLFGSLQFASAQNVKITGKIIDADNFPLAGVHVVVEGTKVNAFADTDGAYTISAPSNGKLVFSFIGYKTLIIDIAGRENIDVTMEDDAVALEQVMVVAYGEQKKAAFTGSASIVSSEEIARRPVTNVMSALEGIASGVQVQSTSGAPGSDPEFRIRGVSSINSGRDPLIVVDGVPYDSGWNNINPNDVESVTVLKDAASIAIYGARGGNGVILVTTKRTGKSEEVKIAFDAKFAISNVRQSDLYDVIRKSGEYYERHYDALYNYYRNVAGYNEYEANKMVNASWTKNADQGGLGYLVYTVPQGQVLVGQNGKLNPNASLGRMVAGQKGDTYYQTPDDWIDNTYVTGYRQDYNLSISGGTKKLSMLATAGYTKETGITDKADYERFTGRMKGVFDAKKWLKLNAALDIAVSDQNNDTDYADNSNNVFSNALRVAPIYPIFVRDAEKNILYDENGKVYDYGDGTYNDGIARPVNTGSNRLQEAQLQTKNTKSVKVGAQGGAVFQITSDLSATLNVSYDARNRKYRSTGQPFYGTSNPGGYVSLTNYKDETLNLQQLINYNTSFGNHNVKVVLLHEWYKKNYEYQYGRKDNMFSYFQNQDFAGAVTMVGINGYNRPYQSEGWGGRAMYDYNGTYYVDASYRRDGSSRFDPAHRWGNFFSFGGSWIMSRENFFQASWVDELKLKASYGQNGNDQIGSSYNRYEDAYNIENVNGEIALTFDSRGNPDITWETRTAINVGLEFKLFEGRLSGGVDYYYNKTTDMLSAVPVPYSLGYSSYWANVGDMRNSGFEFELRGDIIRTKDFRWSMYLNASLNDSKILRLEENRMGETIYDINGNEIAKGYSSGNYFYGEGLEYRTWYLKKFAGTDDQGRATWYVMNQETKELTTTTTYSSASYFDCGSSQPKVIGGFGGNFSWKDFQLSFAFAYRLGGYGMDSGYSTLMTAPYNGRTGYNFHKDAEKSWTPENQSNDYARWQYDDRYFTSASDRWLTKSDYLSLQNVSISYTLPKAYTQKLGIDGLTAAIGVDNLFMLTHRRGYVPTHDFDGNVDFGYYPAMSRYTFSLGFKF